MPFLPIWGKGRASKNNIVGAIGGIFLFQASSKTLTLFSPFVDSKLEWIIDVKTLKNSNSKLCRYCIHKFKSFLVLQRGKKTPPPFFSHICDNLKKKSEVKMTLKHNKYNPTKCTFYYIHGSKPNLGYEFDVQKQILTKIEILFFICMFQFSHEATLEASWLPIVS
jgi:hypothetical protein